MNRVNKYVKWEDKEYAHLIGDEPAQYCDMCAFRDTCSQVITKKIRYDDSPMTICEKLSEEENTNYSFFVESKDAERWCK